MKTKLLLSALCAVLLPITCFGGSNPSSLTMSESPLSNSVATELLGKVFMHHPSLLSNAEVKIIDSQTSERFTSKNLHPNYTDMLCASSPPSRPSAPRPSCPPPPPQ